MERKINREQIKYRKVLTIENNVLNISTNLTRIMWSFEKLVTGDVLGKAQ